MLLLRSDAVSGLRSDAEGKALVSSGLRSDAVSGLRSDAEGKALVSSELRSDAVSGLRSDAVGKAQYVIYMYCMVCGSLGELTKLRAYSLRFWFQVLPLAKGRARVDDIAHTTVSVFVLGVDTVFLDMF